MTATDASPDVPPARRAPAMSPEDRRAQIVDATIPLVLTAGAAVTSKQIAEAAGVAEGTVFRAFGDKDAVIDAAVAKYLDPEPLRVRLRAMDPNLPVEVKVRQILSMLQQRFQGVFAMMAAVGMRERPSVPRDAGDGFAQIIADLFAHDARRLGVSVERIGPFLRALSFVTSIGPFQAAGPIELDELVDLALHGIAGERPGARAGGEQAAGEQAAREQATGTQASAAPTEIEEDRC